MKNEGDTESRYRFHMRSKSVSLSHVQQVSITIACPCPGGHLGKMADILFILLITNSFLIFPQDRTSILISYYHTYTAGKEE